jgi:hypothetical protein
MPTKAERPSEGGHWYDQHGNQIGEVERAKGDGMRKPTLRDARKNNWGPGVTTIIGCAAAPGLTRWKQQQAALSALRIHRYVNDSTEEWMARVLEDAAKIAKDAAEEGTRIHKSIEQFYREEPFDKNYRAHVYGVSELIKENCDTAETLHPWLAETGVAHGQPEDLREPLDAASCNPAGPRPQGSNETQEGLRDRLRIADPPFLLFLREGHGGAT